MSLRRLQSFLALGKILRREGGRGCPKCGKICSDDSEATWRPDMWVLDPQTIWSMREGLQPWPVAPLPSPSQLRGGRLVEEGVNVTHPPAASQRPCEPPAPSSQGPPWPSPRLSPARKGEVGLRVLLECCLNLGLGLLGPAALSCSQGLAGACWLPQCPELAD